MPNIFKSSLLGATLSLCAGMAIAADQNRPDPVSFLISEMTSLEQSSASSLSASNMNSNRNAHPKNINNNNSSDKLNYALRSDKTQATAIISKLTATYGPPTITRGSLKVWEMENTNRGFGQARVITIMAGEDSSGHFIKLDRQGPNPGNNPRLTAQKPDPEPPQPIQNNKAPSALPIGTTGRPALSDRG